MIIDRGSPGRNCRARPGAAVISFSLRQGWEGGRGCGELKMTPLISGVNGEKRINKKSRAINLSHEHVPVTSGPATLG